MEAAALALLVAALGLAAGQWRKLDRVAESAASLLARFIAHEQRCRELHGERGERLGRIEEKLDGLIAGERRRRT